MEEYTGTLNPNDASYRIAMLAGTTTKTIIDSLTFDQTPYVGDGIHFFDNKMYVCISSMLSDTKSTNAIYEIDLKTGVKNEILDVSMKDAVLLNFYVLRECSINKSKQDENEIEESIDDGLVVFLIPQLHNMSDKGVHIYNLGTGNFSVG